MSRKSLVVMITFGLLGLCPLLLRAQDEEPSIDSMIEILRTGMQADKATIVATGMNLSDKDGAAFWPIYRQYEHERSMVDDGRVTVIREYTTKYPTLTDADAKAMAQRMFDYDSRIAALTKRYFQSSLRWSPPLP